MQTAAKVVGDYDLFLFDLDGTLISSYMDNPETVEKDYHKWDVLPGRKITLDALRKQDKRIAVVTNQGGLAFGYNTIHDWVTKQIRVCRELELGLGDFFTCFGHPKGTVKRCDPPNHNLFLKEWDHTRRKPSGRMIQEAMDSVLVPKERTVMVGDMETDRLAAMGAGVDYIDAKEFFE